MTAIFEHPVETLLGQDETQVCGTQYLQAANANCIANIVLAPPTQQISALQL